MSLRTREIQSTRFLAKRETLFVTIRSYSPFSQAAIMSLNAVRFFSETPEIPSSA